MHIESLDPRLRVSSQVEPQSDKDLVISVVIILHDEENKIWQLVDKAVGILNFTYRNYELIFIDDGSCDTMATVIRNHVAHLDNARLLVLSKPFGDQIAMTAGIDHAIGDFVVLLPTLFDGMPELIPTLVDRARQGFDVVYLQWRDGLQRAPILYRLVLSTFYWVNNHLTGIRIEKGATDFLVLSRRVVNAITKLKEHNRYLRMLFNSVGYNIDAILVNRPRNMPFDKRISASKIRLAFDSLISFSHRPLRYLSFLSVFISITAFIGAVVVFLNKLVSNNAIGGWTSLMVVVLLLFCMLFLFLSIISEYIFRIFDESKNRPLYYVREEYGGTHLDVANIIDIS
jgi:polyisoprenyl-phosphate glycosyltransferase